MNLKYDTRDPVIKFILMVKIQFNSKVKIVQSDNGFDFKLVNFCINTSIYFKNTLNFLI